MPRGVSLFFGYELLCQTSWRHAKCQNYFFRAPQELKPIEKYSHIITICSSVGKNDFLDPILMPD